MALLCAALAWQENKRKERGSQLNALAEQEKSLKATIEACQEDNPMVEDNDFASPPQNMKRAKLGKEAEPSIYAQLALPRIFICSRTHKQIAQLVKELGRTSYRPSFVVLASRAQYCINEAVRREPDINDACRKALSEKAGNGNGCNCSYFRGMSNAKKDNAKATPDMDIEDLVKAGKKGRFCPYFAAREALEKAEVVFAPYNYLVDPSVRAAMGVELTGQDVVIIDEAHNIEDVCRDAGSAEITDDALHAINGELHHIVLTLKKNGTASDTLEAHEALQHVAAVLGNWLRHGIDGDKRGAQRRDFETATTIWTGTQIIEELRALGITFEALSVWLGHLKRIFESSNKAKGTGQSQKEGEEREQLLSFGSSQLLQGLLSAMSHVLKESQRHLDSYRMVRWQLASRGSADPSNAKRMVTTLGFWCLHPEVVFGGLVNLVNAVVLTSGTLAPMETFASELGTRFEQRLEALHVIPERQTWIGAVSAGPKGSPFLGNYKTMDSFAYQDDLGQAILQIVKTVPFGVLCFVPSYSFMDKLVRRLQATGVWEQLGKLKKLFQEPQQGGAKDFEKLMTSYYDTIASCEKGPQKLNGALCFAVYRGKISEGLDLRDNNCRAVLAIGIPYPAFKDPKVMLKREFNDQHANQKKLLRGQQ